MFIRLGNISLFLFVFLVLLGASQARFGMYEPLFIDKNSENIELVPQIFPVNVKNNVLINEQAKSTYIGDLHAKLLDKYGTKFIWRIDVCLCLCFSLLFTDLAFRLFFCIASRCSTLLKTKSLKSNPSRPLLPR
ncbi:hypothetical protein EUTSA_v10002854mg [Eutrema salsugineum]|uniref:Uncharacterized protein n=1 Tax=Eutrema salsugineum TaxID=72664 RepID=V4KHS4_EUTSA|nr:uncharacterized protein LOC18014171 [Eutrema salsugineum]ESQ37387.1 hypothetical protein EUTSA_v10002870mg [Eutrema salsugineum]ESQ37395.1 hypothetical protein EUTSA_v10002854mg [Eutrema salsugineum]